MKSGFLANFGYRCRILEVKKRKIIRILLGIHFWGLNCTIVDLKCLKFDNNKEEEEEEEEKEKKEGEKLEEKKEETNDKIGQKSHIKHWEKAPQICQRKHNNKILQLQTTERGLIGGMYQKK